MTFLDWGCDPLAAECESCIDALCNVCHEEFKRAKGRHAMSGSPDDAGLDTSGLDCDTCDPVKKTACSGCGIIVQVCRKCSENATCAFRISE